jgi:hypothetical protein
LHNASDSWTLIQHLARVAVLLSAALAGAVMAAGAPYGEHFALAGARWGDAGPGGAGGRMVASPAQAADYQVAISRYEQQAGPYSDRLAEPVAALARQYRAAGDYNSAQRLYRRALHVVRINDGLYSKRQVPLLRELLQSYREAGDYETLDERYDYYFRLYGNGQPPYTEIRLRAALEYLRWQREALRLGVGGGELERLLHLYELNQDLLQGLEGAPGVDFVQRRALVLSQLRNLYLLQERGPAQPYNRGGSAPGSEPLATQPFDISVAQQKLENMQRGALGNGEDLLESLLPAARLEGPVEEARLQLALGDWRQWQGNSARAGKAYAEVARLLQEAGEEELLGQWLAQPVELPDNGAFWQPATAQGGTLISARFDVSARGRVSNIETAVDDPELQGRASALRRWLVKTRFRPRWEAGEARAVAGVQRDYLLRD